MPNRRLAHIRSVQAYQNVGLPQGNCKICGTLRVNFKASAGGQYQARLLLPCDVPLGVGMRYLYVEQRTNFVT